MKRTGIARLILLVLLLGCLKTPIVSCDQSGESWKNISTGVTDTDLRTVSTDPSVPDIIYAGSTRGIFKSPDNGNNWQRLYPASGLVTGINTILVDPDNTAVIYAATQNGLFKSSDSGAAWNKVFEGLSEQEKDITHIAISPKSRIIYFGTDSGAFTSNDDGKSWNKLKGETSGQIINFIAPDPNDPSIIYMAASAGIYKTKDGGIAWERIFNAAAQIETTETAENCAETNTDETEPPSGRTPNCIMIDKGVTNKIYIGTWSGVFVSGDAGATWEEMTGSGLLNRKVNYLLMPKDGTIYAATDGGVFSIAAPYIHWDEVYNGLTSKATRYLAYNKKDNAVLAATKKGIFEICLDSAPVPELKEAVCAEDPRIKKVLLSFDHEPTIQEVQDVATKYAEVHKKKIDEWRSDVKKSALWPTLSVGVTHDESNNCQIYTSATQHYCVTGPDDKSTGWDAKVSWDLSKVIWNNDQNNIDVRSRLMVQLRDDVLNEVTRLYFERRRLQINLLTSPSNNMHTNLERELRLQELTAGIDALTGGWFSKKCDKNI